jgi:hypothetical protein
MKHMTSRELYAYWNRVRRGRPAPRRNDIEPSDIRRILADTFILEVGDRDRLPIRLAGTRMCGLYCREIKGGDFLDLWAPNDRNAIATLATAVGVDAAAAVVTVDAINARGKRLTCEVLLLPLRHNGPNYDRILGSYAPLERPYWLGTEPILRQTLTSLRLIWPDEQPTFLRRASDQAVSSPIIPFPLPDRRRRGHLTVLDGGKQ